MEELWGIARFRIHEGKLEEFKGLSAQAREIVRSKDIGTLQYDSYFNDDQSECVVLERYRDSEAAIEHAANLGELSAAVLATVSVVTASSSVSRAQSCERIWRVAKCRFSSRPTSRCSTAPSRVTYAVVA